MDASSLDFISQVVFSKNFAELSIDEREFVLDGLENAFEPPSRSNSKRNWWLQTLLDKLDRSAGKERASRGRSYWRKGKVGKRLTITENIGIGTVRSSSSGSYSVGIRIGDGFKDHAESLATAIANDSSCYVDFREGRLNQKLLELTLGDGSNVFKDHLQVVGYCDCYDWGAICKHQVALANAIADKVQEDLDLALTFLGIDPKVLNGLVSQLRDGESKDLPQNNPDNVTDSFGWPTYSDIGRVAAVRRFGKTLTVLAEQLGELEKQPIDTVGAIPKNRINSNLGTFADIFATIYDLVKIHVDEE